MKNKVIILFISSLLVLFSTLAFGQSTSLSNSIDIKGKPLLEAYQAKKEITARIQVSSEQVVSLKAGNYIEFKLGTHIEPGAIFSAFIEPIEAANDALDNKKTNIQAKKAVEATTLDAHYELTNYPNPCMTNTTIAYELPKRELVSIILYDTKGQIKQLVVDNETREKGSHTVALETSNLADGIYYYMMQVGATLKTNKLVVSK